MEPAGRHRRPRPVTGPGDQRSSRAPWTPEPALRPRRRLGTEGASAEGSGADADASLATGRFTAKVHCGYRLCLVRGRPMPSTLTTYLVLLRGINVGGKNKVPMGRLREVL